MRFSLVMLLSLLLALPTGAASTAPEGDERRTALTAENRFLRAEHELAGQQKVYFQFDLAGRQVRLKTSGVVVAELAVTGGRRWGPSPTAAVRTLVAKDALFPPQRKQIEIPDGQSQEKKAPFELQTLELDDMPTAFHARLDDGTRLSLLAAPTGLFSRGWEALRVVFWYLTRPLISDWHFLRGRAYTELRLLLPARDVQMLYWSLIEGSGCLLGATPAPGKTAR